MFLNYHLKALTSRFLCFLRPVTTHPPTRFQANRFLTEILLRNFYKHLIFLLLYLIAPFNFLALSFLTFYFTKKKAELSYYLCSKKKVYNYIA